jgi:hypothetical protein
MLTEKIQIFLQISNKIRISKQILKIMLFQYKRKKNKKFSKIRNFRQILVEIKIYFNLNKYPRKLKSLFKMQDNKIKFNLILISLLDYNHNKKRMMKK